MIAENPPRAAPSVLIAGGAAMGSATAAFLLSDPEFRGRVLVIEKDPAYRRSASALSAASIRQQFSTAVNVRISLFGIRFLREIGERLAIAGERPAVDLCEGGYLYLAGPGGATAIAGNHALQSAEGADIALLDRAALGDRFPWLFVDDLECASLGLSGEGWFDGWALLQAFRCKARALGAEYRTGEIVRVERTRDRATAVVCADGVRIACDVLVNCAGAGGPALAAAAGIAIPVAAKRRSVFAFRCPTALERCPLIVDTTGVWLRPEGDGYICGVSPRPGEPDPDWVDADAATQQPDWNLFEASIWPSLAHRVPAFAAIRPGRAWAGPYDMCTLDHNAIVGPACGLPNFYLCNGFSGHGLQQAPAIARGLAELIVHGGYRTLDLAELGHERVLAGRPLVEANVI